MCVSHDRICWVLPKVTDFTFPRQLGTKASQRDTWEMCCHKRRVLFVIAWDTPNQGLESQHSFLSFPQAKEKH